MTTIDDRVAVIRKRLDRLARLDERRRVFGADIHGYRLGPGLSEQALAEAEADAGVTLPEAYRRFVTELGDEGAGPHYGLMGVQPPMGEDDDEPAPARPFPWRTETPAETEPPDGAHRLDGTMVLCDQGCGTMSLLVVTGPARGEVWSDDTANDGPLVPDAPDFLTWYERWLDRAQTEIDSTAG